MLTFEQELSTINQRQTYELPLGLKATLDDFSIQIHTFNDDVQPKIISSDYKNFFFEQNNDGFTANLERRNQMPKSPVIVALSNPRGTQTVLSYHDYFYINQTLQPDTRLKQKPKKITLLWDTSYSLRNRNLDKELSILEEYFEYLRDVEVHFISFSNAIHQNTVFKMQNGNWGTLKNVLQQSVYDGGTALNLFESLLKNSDETLFFSDGLVNLGPYSSKNKKPIYMINSTTSANHEWLNEMATASGGSYVNLVRLPRTEAVNTLKRETFQFLGAVHDSSIYEVYPRNKTNVSENFSISGRFSEENNIELLFGYGGKVTERIEVPIKKSQETDVVKRLWAKQKLKHLNADKNQNKEPIIALAKTHHLITEYTSMLILDRIEDYVRYRIEPPQELKAEYKARISNLAEEEADILADLNCR